MKFSIIMPVFNNFDLTVGAVRSVQEHTKDYELIIVDNGSIDETPAYLQSLPGKHPDIKICTLPENAGFAVASNLGLKEAKGDYLILLNNDTDVTQDWADHLVEAIPLAQKEFDARPIGIIGPVTNNAGGNQRVQADPYTPDQLQHAAAQRHKDLAGKTRLAGFISGFCMLITRPCFEDVGLLDEVFKIGGVEDTDYCVRALRKGWKLAIDDSTFIHHFGQQTINAMGDAYRPIHRGNQLKFLEKYYDPDHKKLIATFRVRNQPDFLRRSLARAAQFCDGIVVLCDRCDTATLDVAENADKLLRVIQVHQEWDLYRDRASMMEYAKRYDPDWIIALDADEFLEDSFTYDVAQRLMHPLDPNVNAYSFDFCTFFLGDTHYRTDGVFGRMRGLRMYRNLPAQKPRMMHGSHRTCLHCPPIATFNVRPLRYRVKHYGYDSQAVCDEKYAFYTHLDPNPDKGYIGPEGYEHLKAQSLTVQRWQEKNDLALCMIVKNEEVNLFSFLYRYHSFFDQIVIVDTGSKDKTRDVAEMFGAEVYRIPWPKSFAEARNFAKSRCTTSWLFTCDPDEDFDAYQITAIYQMLNSPVHAWLFQIINFKLDGEVFYSDNVRLVRNIPEIYWSHHVHENITESVKKNGLKVTLAPFKIKHYGYLKAPFVIERKSSQYTTLLRKDLREDHKCALTHFHMAFHYFDANKPQRGEKSLKRALELQPDLFIASKELGLRHLESATRYLTQSRDSTPQDHYFKSWLTQAVTGTQNIMRQPIH